MRQRSNDLGPFSISGLDPDANLIDFIAVNCLKKAVENGFRSPVQFWIQDAKGSEFTAMDYSYFSTAEAFADSPDPGSSAGQLTPPFTAFLSDTEGRILEFGLSTEDLEAWTKKALESEHAADHVDRVEKELSDGTVSLTLAHHCLCLCGEGLPRAYSVAVWPEKVEEEKPINVMRLDSQELGALLDAITQGLSAQHDVSGTSQQSAKPTANPGRVRFQMEKRATAVAVYFVLRVSGRVNAALLLNESDLRAFLQSALELKRKEGMLSGCTVGNTFHPLKETRGAWLILPV